MQSRLQQIADLPGWIDLVLALSPFVANVIVWLSPFQSICALEQAGVELFAPFVVNEKREKLEAYFDYHHHWGSFLAQLTILCVQLLIYLCICLYVHAYCGWVFFVLFVLAIGFWGWLVIGGNMQRVTSLQDYVDAYKSAGAKAGSKITPWSLILTRWRVSMLPLSVFAPIIWLLTKP